MSNVLWLLVLLAFAAAAVIFTLAFVALADRRMSEGTGGREGSRRDEENRQETRREGRDEADHEPRSQPQDQDGGEEKERSP